MSLFGTILSKIFPSNHPAVAAQQGNASNPPGATPGAQASQQSVGGAAGRATPGMQQASGSGATMQQGGATGGQQAGSSTTQVDVEQILNRMAQQQSEKLNWRTSIVDLMKLLGMDSSLNARKELARELHYTGDTNDSAAMNMWLQKQVMAKLAENGGKVPPELLH